MKKTVSKQKEQKNKKVKKKSIKNLKQEKTKQEEKKEKDKKETIIKTVKNSSVIVSSNEKTPRSNPFRQENGGDSDFFEVGVMANAMDFKKESQDSLSFNLEQELQDAPTNQASTGGVDYSNSNSNNDYFSVNPNEFAPENIDIYQTSNGNGENYASYDSQTNINAQPTNSTNTSLDSNGFVNPYPEEKSQTSTKYPQAGAGSLSGNYEPPKKKKEVMY